jgi:arabinogalactan endo-1,4-beta-galactosidase
MLGFTLSDNKSGRGRAAAFSGMFVVALMLAVSAPARAQTFAKGADVSWMTQMEASGYRWSNDAGTQQDLLQILKDHSINTIRLRVWVNPSGGWNGVNDVVAKAIRARNAGMRIMIDFHYSDSWADPGKQTKPAAWASHNFTQLMNDVYQHTFNTMNTLATNGIFPEWVQVGNETNNGMLWEDGRASTSATTMRNYAWLVNSGYDAVKAVSPNSKVIVHLSNGYDNALFRWNFDGLRTNGARWDIIGMSLYPEPGNWQTLVGQTITNINDMRSRYGKGVMIVEVGMSFDQATASKAFLTDIITRSRNAGALGVIYWEPQAYNWQGYTKGAWNTNGRPTIALDAFIEGTTPQPPGSITVQENLTGFCGVDGTVDSNNAGYTGTGFANTNNATGTTVRWRVNAAAAGNFTLQWRFANGTTGNRPGTLRLNGVNGTAVNLPATGAWTTWTNSSSITASLRAGANDIALVASTSGGLANIDSMTVTGSGISAVACN